MGNERASKAQLHLLLAIKRKCNLAFLSEKEIGMPYRNNSEFQFSFPDDGSCDFMSQVVLHKNNFIRKKLDYTYTYMDI